MDEALAAHYPPQQHASPPPARRPGQSEAKRRRLRKGTHSCWECKRRKMGCMFDPLTDATTCNGCRRRGSKCVSQELPEEVSLSVNKTRHGGAFMGEAPQTHAPRAFLRPSRSVSDDSDGNTNDETSRSSPTTPLDDGGYRRAGGLPTPLSATSSIARYLGRPHEHRTAEHDILQSATQATSEYARLSRLLYESLPSRKDTEKICKAGRRLSVLGHQMLTVPYETLERSGLETPESLLEFPEPNLHPVLIARHMLLLATSLQHLQPDLDDEIKNLSEPPRAMMKRLAGLATNLIATNDEDLSSVEGLECVMVESVYQANVGDIRKSWLSCRKAMSIAQLMELDKSDSHTRHRVLESKTEYNPQLMWFRIVFLDRYLSLMLGVSQGSLDRSMASEALLEADTPMGRLERVNCVVASRIIERNESKSSLLDLELTRTLDAELQRAARSLPSKWWLAPSRDAGSADSEALFWNTRRIIAHIIHYNLLNQLHLPFMLRASLAQGRYEHSRMTCVNASREVLSRFVLLRSLSGIAYRCRTIDFVALMAALTLLLAYLDGQAENFLPHQYHSDRAMIEQMQENMEEFNRLSSDSLTAQSITLLRQLMAIDVESLSSSPLRATTRVSVHEAADDTPASARGEDVVIVSARIPYFGFVKIARGSTAKETAKPQSGAASAASLVAQPRAAANESTGSPATTTATTHRTEPQTIPSDISTPSGIPNTEATTPADAAYGDFATQLMLSGDCAKPPGMLSMPPVNSARKSGADLASQSHGSPTHSLRQYEQYPERLWQYGDYTETVARGDGWSFQNVDLTFFEGIIRNIGNGGAENGEWPASAVESSLNG